MRLVPRSTNPRLAACGALMGAMLLVVAMPAHAALTTPSCLAKKLKEWGKLRKCQAVENGKILQLGPGNLGKCQTKFSTKMAALTALATATSVPCRYHVDPDGTTATDYDTGLQWERKTTDGSVHDKGHMYSWSASGSAPDGTAFTSFLYTLNASLSVNGDVTVGCFAGHCDWRLPAIEELVAIVDLTAPGCGTPTTPCIDQTVFGPTTNSFYMSATTDAGGTGYFFNVYLFDGSVGDGNKTLGPDFARAVRSAL